MLKIVCAVIEGRFVFVCTRVVSGMRRSAYFTNECFLVVGSSMFRFRNGRLLFLFVFYPVNRRYRGIVLCSCVHNTMSVCTLRDNVCASCSPASSLSLPFSSRPIGCLRARRNVSPGKLHTRNNIIIVRGNRLGKGQG